MRVITCIGDLITFNAELVGAKKRRHALRRADWGVGAAHINSFKRGMEYTGKGVYGQWVLN